jgi:hypothetical protein
VQIEGSDTDVGSPAEHPEKVLPLLDARPGRQDGGPVIKAIRLGKQAGEQTSLVRRRTRGR